MANPRSITDILLAGSLHKELGQMFMAFAKKEYAFENLLCWGAIMAFEGKKNIVVPDCPGANDYERAMWIYLMFLQGSKSPHEVNVSRSNVKPIEETLFPKTQQTGRPNGRRQAIHVSKSLFSSLLNALNTNMSDTWSRFQFSKEYLAYQNRGRTKILKVFGHKTY